MYNPYCEPPVDDRSPVLSTIAKLLTYRTRIVDLFDDVWGVMASILLIALPLVPPINHRPPNLLQLQPGDSSGAPPSLSALARPEN